MTLSQLINIALYAVIALFAILGFISGAKRGIARQSIKLVVVVTAFILAFLLFSAIYPAFFSLLNNKNLAELANMYGITLDYNWTRICECIEGDTAAYLAAVPLTLIVLPIFFLLFFGIIDGLLRIPYMVVSGALGFAKRCNTKWTRILGGFLGMLQGVLIGLLVLVPFDGVVGVAHEAIVVAENEHPDSTNSKAMSNFYHMNFDQVESNFVFKASDATFGFVYDKFSTIDIKGEAVDVKQITDDLFELFVLYGDLGADFNYKSLRPEDKDVLDEMLECFGDDELMKEIVSGALSAVGKASNNGALTLTFAEPMQSISLALLDICSTSTSETVEGDLHIMMQVYYLFSDEGMLLAENKNDMFKSFLTLDADGDSAFKRMVAIYDTNPRFSDMSEVCSEVAMDMLLHNSGVSQDVMETVNNVKDGVNNVVGLNREDYATEEEYKADVTEGISTTLKENGISLSEDKLDVLTDFVIENYGDKTEISDEEFLDFMSKYYDIYAKGGSIENLPGGSTEDGGASDGGTEDGDVSGDDVQNGGTEGDGTQEGETSGEGDMQNAA